MKLTTRIISLIPICATFFLAHAQSSPTKIEQDDPSIVYTGTWYPNSESPNSGGTATLTNAKDATAAITFNGTGITWIGVTDPYSGLAQVYLDGTPNIVDSYSDSTQYQQPLFTAHGLAPGTHTLSIQVMHQRDGNTSGSWVWIDRFDIDNGTGVPGGVSAPAGRVQQNDPSIMYTGKWFLNTNAAQSGGTAVLAMDVGSRMTITFNGTGIRWIAYRDPWSGIANVYVDGILTAAVDTYQEVEQAQSVAYDIGGLSSGSHSLTIEITGKRNPQSGGSWIWVDAFDVR